MSLKKRGGRMFPTAWYQQWLSRQAEYYDYYNQ